MVRPPPASRDKDIRFPVHVPAVSELLGAADTPEVGEAYNLSQGGILLRVKKPLAPGAAVRVTLRLKLRPPLTLVGQVVWSGPHPDLPGWAVGIRFSEALPGELVVEIADEEYPPWGGPPIQTDPGR